MGYKLIKIHEIHHFPKTTKYDPHTKKGGLFSGYIDRFLKIKQEACGYPEGVTTPEQQQQYINDYYEHEGIQLDADKIKKNPSLRSLAKLTLNSLWGKFGQKSDYTNTVMINDIGTLFKHLLDPTKKIHNWHIINEVFLSLEFSRGKAHQEPSVITNLYLAIFTTAHARLRLYNLLERLGTNVLYTDTDSVIYKAHPPMIDIPVGDYHQTSIL